MTILDKLNDVFRQVFEDDEITVGHATTADDIEGWDSLSHVNLVVAVEAVFSIRFAQKELLSFKNVGDMLRCIEAKLCKA